MRIADIYFPTDKPTGWRPPDGWTPEWRAWFSQAARPDGRAQRRSRVIQQTVRRTLEELPSVERRIIEGYFYDGRPFARIADDLGISLVRVQVLRRRALGHLRSQLAPFVQATFGLGATQTPDCPICRAPWREIAEDLLDEKTPDVTWGVVARRLERAVGWSPSTVQLLIGHQKNHRVYSEAQPTATDGLLPTEEFEEVA